jgi:hypothetical protein
MNERERETGRKWKSRVLEDFTAFSNSEAPSKF